MFSDFNFIIYFIIDYIVVCLLTPFVYSVGNCAARRETTEEFYKKKPTLPGWYVCTQLNQSLQFPKSSL